MGPRIDETQLASMASWMQFYDITLVVCSPRADVERWVALICQFARLHTHWAPARWAEIDGAWTRVGQYKKPIFPARWLRLDLSPACHPDTLLGVGTVPLTAFQKMAIETSRLNRACITDCVVWALRNVHTLDLRYTRISDAGALSLGESSTLHTLDLRGTEITDIGAARLRNVRILNLSETSVTDEAALALSLGSVHTLDLSETGVTDVGAVALSKSRTLHTLSLRGTMVTDVGAAALGTLRTLDLSETCITDVAAVALGSAPTLHTLDLCGTRITDIGAAALGASTKLHTLIVFRTSITAVGAAALRNASGVRTLKLHTLAPPHLARFATADAHGQHVARAPDDAPMLLRAWVYATYTRVPLCEKGTGTNLRALYAAYVRANPPVHVRMLSQVSFAHMLGGIHAPRPVLDRARRLRYVYPLR